MYVYLLYKRTSEQCYMDNILYDYYMNNIILFHPFQPCILVKYPRSSTVCSLQLIVFVQQTQIYIYSSVVSTETDFFLHFTLPK